ncbi:unnamed protein product [Closterium sp. NIES-53]
MNDSTGALLVTFTREPRFGIYVLHTERSEVAASPQIAVSGQVAVSSQVATSCSYWSLTHPTVLWHHRLRHSSLPRLRSMASQRLVSRLPRDFASLPPSPAQSCTPCVEGRLRATPHSSLRLAIAPFQTLHLDATLGSRVLCLHSDRGVWACLALVRDTSANKLSARAIPYVFLGFPVDSPDFEFYHPPLHRFLNSCDITFDESVSYYIRYPCRGLPVSPPPLFLAPTPPAPAPPVPQPTQVLPRQADDTHFTIHIGDVLVAPDLQYNLLSSAQLMRCGVDIRSNCKDKTFELYYKNTYIGKADDDDGVFVLNFLAQGTTGAPERTLLLKTTPTEPMAWSHPEEMDIERPTSDGLLRLHTIPTASTSNPGGTGPATMEEEEDSGKSATTKPDIGENITAPATGWGSPGPVVGPWGEVLTPEEADVAAGGGRGTSTKERWGQSAPAYPEAPGLPPAEVAAVDPYWATRGTSWGGPPLPDQYALDTPEPVQEESEEELTYELAQAPPSSSLLVTDEQVHAGKTDDIIGIPRALLERNSVRAFAADADTATDTRPEKQQNDEAARHKYYQKTVRDREEPEIWHQRLGHPSHATLKNSLKAGVFDDDALLLPHGGSLTAESANPPCTVCPTASLAHKPFPYLPPGYERYKPLDKVYSDFMILSQTGLNGIFYTLTFIDACTRYVWAVNTDYRSLSFEFFVAWMKRAERQSGLKLKTYQTDGGLEFFSTEFKEFFKQKGIENLVSLPYAHEQQVWLHNLLSSQSLENNNSPHGAWTGRKSDTRLLRGFGCMVQYKPHTARTGKFADRARWGIHLGIEKEYKAWIVLDYATHEVTKSRDCIFYEKLTLPLFKEHREADRAPERILKGHRSFATPHDEADLAEDADAADVTQFDSTPNIPLTSPFQTPTFILVHQFDPDDTTREAHNYNSAARQSPDVKLPPGTSQDTLHLSNDSDDDVVKVTSSHDYDRLHFEKTNETGLRILGPTFHFSMSRLDKAWRTVNMSLEVWKSEDGPASGRTPTIPPTDISIATLPLLAEVGEPAAEDVEDVPSPFPSPAPHVPPLVADLWKAAEVQQDDEGSEASDDGGDAEESTDTDVVEVQCGPRQSCRIRRPPDFYVPAAFTTAYDEVDDDLQYDDAEEDEDFPELDPDMHAGPEHRWDILTMTVKEVLTSWKGKAVKAAMEEEIRSLVGMGTWELVERSLGVNIMKNRWVMTTKYHINDTVECEKARLVVKGFTQVYGADYDETYAPVSSYVTLRIFLIIVAVLDLNLMQLDMKNAFLQSKLDRVLYMYQPDYFNNGTGRVCKLLKSLYGLKRSPLLWYRALDGVLLGAGWKKSQVDTALYFKVGVDKVTCWVLVYVNDLLAARSSAAMLKELLKAAFELREISPRQKYLGLEIVRDKSVRKLWLHHQG